VEQLEKDAAEAKGVSMAQSIKLKLSERIGKVLAMKVQK